MCERMLNKWSVKYNLKRKRIRDAFAEDNAFLVHFRIGNDVLAAVYNDLTEYSRNICDNKYPCGNGGWLRYRILRDEHLEDVMTIIAAKVNP